MKKSVEDYLAETGIEGEITEVETGNVSETYRIDSETVYYLQVPGHTESLKRGILGLQMQQETDIPVPEIVEYDLDEPFLLTQALPGQNLEETEEDVLYRQTGEILARLHDQDHGYNRYGLMSVEDRELSPSDLESWRHGLDSIFNMYMRNAGKVLPMTEAAALDRYYMENRDTVPEERPAELGHFDLHGDNILQEDGEVTGVLDWDMIRVIDPALEVIKTERQFRRDGKPYQEFRKGYENQREVDIDPETEEIYSFISELSRLSELQYLKESQGRKPTEDEINSTMSEIREITGQ